MPNPGSPKTDANDEYIELYNPNDKVFDLSGFQLTAGTYKYTFPNGQFSLQPHEFKAFYASQTDLSLSNTSSRVQFISPDGDVLAESDTYTDAKDNYGWVFADGLWQWTLTATPDARNVIPGSASNTPLTLGISTARPPATKISRTYSVLKISEVLPHAQKPQSDAEGEFIELYNPNKQAVNLAGYILVSGLKDDHKFVIKGGSIAAGAYKAFYHPETKLTLSNTGGHAKLLAPDGTVVDSTGDYQKATAGQSWIYVGSKWQWTTVPTPGKANVINAPAASNPRSSSGSRIASGSQSNSNATNNGSESSAAPLHPAVLAGVGAVALLYALYEYRHDLANVLYRFRRYREARRAIGQ